MKGGFERHPNRRSWTFGCRVTGCQWVTKDVPASRRINNLEVLFWHESARDRYGKPGNYGCREASCKFVTKRIGDLKRHYSSKHCTQPKKLPCPVFMCKYHEIGFARNDKLRSHFQNVHGGIVQPGKPNQAINPRDKDCAWVKHFRGLDLRSMWPAKINCMRWSQGLFACRVLPSFDIHLHFVTNPGSLSFPYSHHGDCFPCSLSFVTIYNGILAASTEADRLGAQVKKRAWRWGDMLQSVMVSGCSRAFELLQSWGYRIIFWRWARMVLPSHSVSQSYTRNRGPFPSHKPYIDWMPLKISDTREVKWSEVFR